jgi:hypothetical protein
MHPTAGVTAPVTSGGLQPALAPYREQVRADSVPVHPRERSAQWSAVAARDRLRGEPPGRWPPLSARHTAEDTVARAAFYGRDAPDRRGFCLSRWRARRSSSVAPAR